jgi:tRNA pseudouridine38-40 synthase
MKRIMMRVAYDGTNYCGWQVQPNGITIQEVLERHLSELLKEPITLMGASRTDAGVHALGNVAVFDTNARMPGEKISYALNQKLPEDIRIQESREVASDFHPRYQKSEKTYEYRILNRRFPIPTERFYAHFTYVPLNVEKMRQAAEYLVGTHDFKSFCGTGAQVKTTVRRITGLSINKCGDVITIRVSGEGFLYNMVRIIAGTLMEIGSGKYPPERMEDILEGKDRQLAGNTAPARGLTLVKIQYSDGIEEQL